MDRRDFLKLLGITTVSAVLPKTLYFDVGKNLHRIKQPGYPFGFMDYTLNSNYIYIKASEDIFNGQLLTITHDFNAKPMSLSDSGIIKLDGGAVSNIPRGMHGWVFIGPGNMKM